MLNNINDLNSLGVAQLEARDVAAAIKTLKRALIHLKTHVRQEREPERLEESDKHNQISLRGVTIESSASKVFEERSGGNLFAIYSRALVLRDICGEDFSGPCRVAATLLYNMALAYHLVAARKNRNGNAIISTAYLGQAQRLYSCALNVVCTKFGDQDFHDMKLLIMAITNNLGQIHCYFANFSAFRGFLRAMHQLIPDSSPCSQNIHADDKKFFWAGAYAFLDDLSVAPAA